MSAESIDLGFLLSNTKIRRVSKSNILIIAFVATQPLIPVTPQNLCHYNFFSPLNSSFVATLSLSAPLSAGLFSKCGGHLPPFEDRGKSLVTQSTLPEFAVLEPAVQGLELAIRAHERFSEF